MLGSIQVFTPQHIDFQPPNFSVAGPANQSFAGKFLLQQIMAAENATESVSGNDERPAKVAFLPAAPPATAIQSEADPTSVRMAKKVPADQPDLY